MHDTKKEILSYLDNVSLLLLGMLFFAFPLLFTSQTTDAFVLPKQALLATMTLVGLIVLGIKMVLIKKLSLRATPFDLPLFLFVLISFISAILSVNQYDALINFVPLLYAVLLFFLLVNFARSENAILFLFSALVLGACLTSILTVLSYFKVYVLPYPYTHAQIFSTLGSLLDQGIYFSLVLPLAGYIAWPLIKPYVMNRKHHFVSSSEKARLKMIGILYSVAFVILTAGVAVTVYMLLAVQKPIILPFETGFQTAFASISQDAGRVLKSFLFGSGYGTYITDFARFKQAAYNLNPDLWSFTFFRSSSYVLELLATVGFLGTAAFFFLIYRIFSEKSFFLPIVLAVVASFLLPFSFTIQVLFFVLLGLFASVRALQNPRRYPDLEFYMVAMKKGFLQAVNVEEHTPTNKAHSVILPVVSFLVIGILAAILGYISYRYVTADLMLQKSLVAASQNNGLATYNAQRDAINAFPYRDATYRLFSSTNLALANALAASQQEGKPVDQTVQNNILQLIQQSINAGRQAVTISPQTALNWNQLSSVYRSLINFGQNADQFAIITNQQAIALDPTNPQQYINLGGIYYQLGQWDNAQNQFQVAINLKQDYANAWYNLGHTFESKGDLQTALSVYQTVKHLVAQDKESAKKITAEIDALQKKIAEGGQQVAGAQTKTPTAPTGQTTSNQPPLDVNQPSNQLPERAPKEEIGGPSVTPTVSASPSPTTSPTPNQ